jgi:hypothetical protein
MDDPVIVFVPLNRATWPDVPEPVMPPDAPQLPHVGDEVVPPLIRQSPVATSFN